MIFDAYKILGCNPKSTDEEIKAAHRALSRKYHPDRPTGDEQLFIQVQQAFALIKDAPARRLTATKLKGLGRECHACEGRGYLRKNRGFTQATFTSCEPCGASGYVRREGRVDK